MPEDEGQHLQDVYAPASALGGPGRFGFVAAAHMIETSRAAGAATRLRLLDAWSPFWDASKSVLLEKSPPNLLRTRFLRSSFPRASFVMIVRHPLAVAAATQKWSGTSIVSLVRHWAVCHRILLDDARRVERLHVVRYEDLVAAPASTLRGIFAFLSLDAVENTPAIRPALNDRYFEWWESRPGSADAIVRMTHLESEINAFGYSIVQARAMMSPSPSLLDPTRH